MATSSDARTERNRLIALAADLDRRIEEIKASSGPGGEARLLLMAALLLSDELHELRDGNAPPPVKQDPKVGRRLRGLAKRAEAIADSAESLPLADRKSDEAGSGDAGQEEPRP